MNSAIRVLPDSAALAAEAAKLIQHAAERRIAEAGRFTLALSGGSTPRRLYERLARKPFRNGIDWSRVSIFFGDERCVPPEHADSNYRMAREALLDHLRIGPANVHRMRGEIDPAAAAEEYDRLLGSELAGGGLDLALLGMGDDGHTASLFPETAALNETQRACVANFVPALDAWRLTLTAPMFNRSGQIFVLVTGAAKAARLAEVLEGPREPQRLPIQLICPTTGAMKWLIDTAAAGM